MTHKPESKRTYLNACPVHEETRPSFRDQLPQPLFACGGSATSTERCDQKGISREIFTRRYTYIVKIVREQGDCLFSTDHEVVVC